MNCRAASRDRVRAGGTERAEAATEGAPDRRIARRGMERAGAYTVRRKRNTYLTGWPLRNAGLNFHAFTAERIIRSA